MANLMVVIGFSHPSPKSLSDLRYVCGEPRIDSFVLLRVLDSERSEMAGRF